MAACGPVCSFRCTRVAARYLSAAAPASAPEFDSVSRRHIGCSPVNDQLHRRLCVHVHWHERCVGTMVHSEGKWSLFITEAYLSCRDSRALRSHMTIKSSSHCRRRLSRSCTPGMILARGLRARCASERWRQSTHGRGASVGSVCGVGPRRSVAPVRLDGASAFGVGSQVTTTSV